jgi:hypothetical protein
MRSAGDFSTFVSAASGLRTVVLDLDDADHAGLDPAIAIRLACASEAMRVVADAMERSPRSLRRSAVDDMHALVSRLALDVSDEWRVHGPLCDAVSILAAAAGSLRPFDAALRGAEFEPDDLRTVPRALVAEWISDAVTASADLEQATDGLEAGGSPRFLPVVREAWAVISGVAVAAMGLSDSSLVESRCFLRKTDGAFALCGLAVDYLTRLDVVGAGGCDRTREAFEAMAATLVRGRELIDGQLARSDMYAAAWRILSRGKAVFVDGEVASIVDGRSRLRFQEDANLAAVLPAFDLAAARRLGAAAYALRSEWAA